MRSPAGCAAVLVFVVLLPSCTCVSRDATGDPAGLGGFERDVLYELRQPVRLFFRKEPETANLPRYVMVPPIGASADERQPRDLETYTQGAVEIATIPGGTRLRVSSVRLYACPDFKETVLYGRLVEGPYKDKLASLNPLSTPITDHVSDVTARNPDPRYIRLVNSPGESTR